MKFCSEKIHVLLLYVITFLDLFAVGLVVPLISSHVTSLGGSHSVVGLMGTFYSGLQLFSSPLIGSLSDVKGRKLCFVITLLICFFTYLLFGLVSSIVVLLILRLILGIFKHTQTLAKAVVADIVPYEDQSDVYGKMAAISGLGIALGPMTGGHILENNPSNGFGIACIITSILFLINAGIAYFVIPPDKPQKKKKDIVQLNYLQVVVDGLTKSIEELRKVDWPNYWDVFLLKALASFSMSIFYSNYSPLLKNYYGLSPKWIGYTISFQGIIGAVCSFFIKYLNKTFYKTDFNFTQRNFHCFSVIALSFLCLLVSNQWLIFTLMLIPLAAGNSVLRLVGIEIIIQKSPDNQKGSLIGATNSVRSISGTVGPMVAGVLADLIGVQYVLMASLIPACIGASISLLKISHIKKIT